MSQSGAVAGAGARCKRTDPHPGTNRPRRKGSGRVLGSASPLNQLTVCLVEQKAPGVSICKKRPNQNFLLVLLVEVSFLYGISQKEKVMSICICCCLLWLRMVTKGGWLVLGLTYPVICRGGWVLGVGQSCSAGEKDREGTDGGGGEDYAAGPRASHPGKCAPSPTRG